MKRTCEPEDHLPDPKKTTAGPYWETKLMPPGATAQSPAGMDATDVNMVYGCEVSNRFAILPVKITESPILRPQKKYSDVPPKIFVPKTRPEVIKILANHKNFILENCSGGTNILPSSIQHHKTIMDFLFETKIEYSSRAPPGARFRRYVLYGLNSTDYDSVASELLQYGVKVERVTQIAVKHPRYHDHTNYVVYIDPATGINLDTLKQIKYLCCQTIKWAAYIINGDGLTKCSRCQELDHPGSHCNMNPRCGVCAGHHLTSVCEFLLTKRANKKNQLDEKLLKCANCGGEHTAGYLKCPYRLEILARKQPKKTKFIPAPKPTTNAWVKDFAPPTQPPIQPVPMTTTMPTTLPMPSFINTSFQRPQVDPNSNSSNINNNSNSSKFNAQEIGAIFSHIIKVIDQCHTKSEQLQVMMQIITQYYI